MEKRVNYEDLIIDLYIFNKLERPSANMSTAKLLFLFEEELYNKNMIGAHYKMKHHMWGPYNQKIGTNLKNLALNGYLKYIENYYDKAEKDVKIYRKNKITTKFLKSIDELIQEYSVIFTVLDDIIYEYGALKTEELKDHLYSLESVGVAYKRIKAYKLYSIILNPDSLRNPKVNFYLDEDWYDTIEILLNPDLLAKIKHVVKTAPHGNFIQL